MKRQEENNIKRNNQKQGIASPAINNVSRLDQQVKKTWRHVRRRVDKSEISSEVAPRTFHSLIPPLTL